MTGFLAALGRDHLRFWRLDRAHRAASWNSGEGARQVGGRWNGVGTQCVYCALDPSTAILEVAVHIGFAALNATPHVLTQGRIKDSSELHICGQAEVPNANWLIPGAASAGQQQFGNQLLSRHKFIAVPSAVSPKSYVLLFSPSSATDGYELEEQIPFALDPRLDPPAR